MDGVGWEAAVKASLVMALVFVFGLAHQRQLRQHYIADDALAGGALAELDAGPDYAGADCADRSADGVLKEVCAETATCCQQEGELSRSGFGSLLSERAETQVEQASQTVSTCSGARAIASLQILLPTHSTCS